MDLQEKIKEMKSLKNSSENTQSQYSCSKCKDTEWLITKDDEGRSVSKYCTCHKQKENDRKLSRTALLNKKDEYTFQKYNAKEDWQLDILEKAKEYVKEPKECWFYIGGQVGAGKTHICTAIVRNIAYRENLSFDYILFNHKMTELKQLKFDEKDKYQNELNKLTTTEILFIDDLFKIEPTKADLDILFDIINERYLNNKLCVISSEKTIKEVYNFDNAIGSRIIEKCKNYVLNIENDDNRNYRLK